MRAMILPSNPCSAACVGASAEWKTGAGTGVLFRGACGVHVAVPIHPIEHQRMQMNVQVGGRAEALDEGDGTGGGLIALLAGLFEQERGNRPMDDLQYREEQVGMNGKETSQRNRQRQHPLAHQHLGDDMVDQMGGGLGHAPRAARGANAVPDGEVTTKGTSKNPVVPAQAGTQSVQVLENTMDWIPAYAGMTKF